MLKRIKIQGYKSLADVEVHLGHLAVLIGPNASGKSNFLDALQLLSRIATYQTLDEAFDPPYRGYPLESFTFGDEGIKSLLEKESVSFSMEVDVQLSTSVIEGINQHIQEIRETAVKGTQSADKPVSKRALSVSEKNLRYRIEIEMLPKQGILRVTDEYLAALNVKGELNKRRKPFLERIGNLLHLRMEGQAHPLYYKRYLDYSILSRSHYPPHYPHLTAMQKELANWLTFYLEPREQMRLPNPVRSVQDIGLMGEDLAAFLNNLQALNKRQFESIEKSLHAMIPSITGIDVSVNELGEVELDLREGEKNVSARILSDGTLRILGLLALVGGEETPTLIGFEEPENGVPPRQIRRIAKFLEARRLLERTQYIVTTHSPILPDFIPVEFLHVCRKIKGNTEIEPFTTLMASIWPKLDIKEALQDEDELSVSEFILRGDLDA